MTTEELCDIHRITRARAEAWRVALSGVFVMDVYDSLTGRHLAKQATPNLVTNEGINKALNVHLGTDSKISTWRLALVKSNTAPAASMTYAAPTYTEIAGSDITESSRPVWTPGTAASQQITNNASPGLATADASFTAYGLALVGGGSAPDTIADTAGGGTLHAYGLFGSPQTVVATNVLQLAYLFTGADDGV